jgi:hypothetical protein
MQAPSKRKKHAASANDPHHKACFNGSGFVDLKSGQKIVESRLGEVRSLKVMKEGDKSRSVQKRGSLPSSARLTALKTVTFKNSLTLLEVGFFRGSQLTSVTLPASVEWVDFYTFSTCKLLRSIDLPGVTLIRKNAFENCVALEDVTLHNDLASITLETGAFSGCSKLEEEMRTYPPTAFGGQQLDEYVRWKAENVKGLQVEQAVEELGKRVEKAGMDVEAANRIVEAAYPQPVEGDGGGLDARLFMQTLFLRNGNFMLNEVLSFVLCGGRTRSVLAPPPVPPTHRRLLHAPSSYEQQFVNWEVLHPQVPHPNDPTDDEIEVFLDVIGQGGLANDD